jgi:ParB/RepB/Spo0J family partition protein
MAIKPKPVKKVLKKKPQRIAPVSRKGKIVTEAEGLKQSSLKIFDIPLSQLVAHEENPNEQSEKVFDEIVNRVKTEGFDEPIIVYPEIKKGVPTGKFKIASGHHRRKAAELAGMKTIPAVIREGWDEDRAAIELVSRNQLRGSIDPHKFTQLYNRLSKRYDEDQLKQMMGLSDKRAFQQLYKQAKDQLPPKAKRKLEEAKEEIHSVEDLSKVLNQIFTEHGSTVDKSMVVFSFGGKEHHYIGLSKAAHKLMKALVVKTEDSDVFMSNVFTRILADTEYLDKIVKAVNNENPSSSEEA